MKKSKIYAISSWFCFLFVLLWMTSCSTRKIATTINKKEDITENLESEKKDSELSESTNVKVTTDLTQTEVSTTETKTYSPVDPTKPSLFIDGSGNKKELTNTSYKEEKTTSHIDKKGTTKTNLSNEKVEKTSTQKSKSTRTETTQIIKDKTTNRTSFNWWWLLFLFIPIGIYLFKKYRNNIWWV